MVDKSFAPDTPEGENDLFYCVDIKPLSEKQILKYIATEIPEHIEIINVIKKHPGIIKLLSKQERLLKLVSVWKNNGGFSKADIKVLKIEESFIDEITHQDIEQKKRLCDAAKAELCGKKICDETIEMFKDTDFFENDIFNYADSKYYLVAEEKELQDAESALPLTEKIKKVLDEWPIEVQYYYAAFYLRRKKDIRKYLSSLVEALDNQSISNKWNKAVILVKTIIFLEKEETKRQWFIDWTVNELAKINYDESIFTALLILNNVLPDNGIEEIIREEYKKTNNAAVKRRLVYFYSRAPFSVPDDIVDDLIISDDIHLKYHIASALVDSYSNNPGIIETQWYENSSYISWPEEFDDDILKSDCEALYCLIDNIEFITDASLTNQHIKRLIEIIEDSSSDYYKKAHAAGALSRKRGINDSQIRSVISELCNILDRDDILKNSKSLKVISYIVESCCKLALREEAREHAINYAKKRFSD
ncbi:MAG: hypothetical protein IJH34_09345, partial [Romboutsia sp.]|nr:hypothetical protein [Romboutsia sp.]